MTNDLVPADNMAALEGLDRQAREVAVTQMLTEARAWLAHAKEATEPATIASFRAQMATVAEATKQLNLSKEIQLDASEMVRRAERGVGKSVRLGQARGEIGTLATNNRNGRGGKQSTTETLVSPEVFTGPGRGRNDIYRMTDDLSDDQFDEALTQAKIEGDLSRANVVRKVEEMRPKPRKTNRRPLVDDALQVSEALRKATVRLENFAGDDRIARNKVEVAARLRSQLDHTLQVCTDLRTLLDQP